MNYDDNYTDSNTEHTLGYIYNFHNTVTLTKQNAFTMKSLMSCLLPIKWKKAKKKLGHQTI